MRLAIGGFGLESVTFLPDVTDIADFENGALRGDDIVPRMRGTASVLGGYFYAQAQDQRAVSDSYALALADNRNPPVTLDTAVAANRSFSTPDLLTIA